MVRATFYSDFVNQIYRIETYNAIKSWCEIISNDPFIAVGGRVYMTNAPEDTDRPFIVWTPISNVPYNALCGRPDSDQQRTQFDVYSHKQKESREIMEATRNAVQYHASIINGPIPLFEADTKLWRWTMDASAFYKRGCQNV